MNKISKSIHEGNLLYKAGAEFIIHSGYSNNILQALEVRNKTYNWIKKRYSNIVPKNIAISKEKANDQDIWLFWWQGFDKAPDLVKICVDSIKEYNSEKTIHYIDKSNILKYVSFPEYIWEKFREGKISITHFSDLLRLELLTKYGGTWIDATVFLTAPIPKLLYNKPVFMFTHSIPDDITIAYNSWFIISERNNGLLNATKRLLYKYWEDNNAIREYFLLHLFITLVIQNNPDLSKNIYYFSDEQSEILSRIFFNTYDDDYWKYLSKISVINKLSNKLNLPSNYHDTYYDYFMNRKL